MAKLPTEVSIAFCNGLILPSDRSSRFVCITLRSTTEYSNVKKAKIYLLCPVYALPEFKIPTPTILNLPLINPLALELDIYSLAHHLCKM